jgi:exosome complex component RRP46
VAVSLTRLISRRAMTCVRGLLQRADGSAQWSQEGTSVIAAVHGPQAAQARSENDERAIVEVVFRPRSGLAGPLQPHS